MTPSGATPLVSIIIPCYVASAKEAELLDETLRTVAAQTCRDYEVLVVDDGSPLDVARIAAGHAATTTLRQANAGPAVARNAGIRCRPPWRRGRATWPSTRSAGSWSGGARR